MLTPLGYEVLELTVSTSGRSRKVLLRIDRLDERVVTMDDVARASEVFGLEL
ncbi:MAG TPA: ribosome maturation factor RimP, partial [Trueperaceae bacterium]|nr:ribosome maturation factor RimP [Trueperaceae bacterium]